MRYVHDPQAKLDYGFDWTAWLDTTETITASTWASAPTGLTLSAPTFDTVSTTVWVEGGATGTTYTLTNHVETSAGRADDRNFELVVRQR